jgi:hypothetical protein
MRCQPARHLMLPDVGSAPELPPGRLKNAALIRKTRAPATIATKSTKMTNRKEAETAHAQGGNQHSAPTFVYLERKWGGGKR